MADVRSRTVPLLAPLVVVALALAALPASADPPPPPPSTAGQYVIVNPNGFAPLPIAIEQAHGPVSAADPFTRTLSADLTISGFFEVLNPKSYLADPRTEGTSASEIDFAKWRAVNASYLTKARLSSTGSQLTMEGWLYDTVRMGELLYVTISGPDDDVPTLAHRWANAIVKAVTGQEGFFLTRIAYVRPAGRGNKDLWVSDLDGRHAMDVTPGGGLNLLPAWSPDGRTIVFTSFRDGSPMLYLVDTITRVVTPLPHRGSLETGGAFSPDGRLITFTFSENGAANIYLMRSDGTDIHPLTQDRETNTSPCWSPDGRRIAFVSTRSGYPQIFVMNADGTGVRRVTFAGNYNQTPDWSPRGDEIVFTARDERNVFDIFKVNVDTSVITRLTQDQGHNEEPSWAPNGASILFTSSRTGRMQLWTMNADGTNQHPLPIKAEAHTPAWGPIP